MMHFFQRRSMPEIRNPESGNWLKDLKSRASQVCERELVVDLSNVEKINSGELGELARIHLILRQNDRRLVLENVRAFVSEVLEITRMNRLVEVRQSQSI